MQAPRVWPLIRAIVLDDARDELVSDSIARSAVADVKRHHVNNSLLSNRAVTRPSCAALSVSQRWRGWSRATSRRSARSALLMRSFITEADVVAFRCDPAPVAMAALVTRRGSHAVNATQAASGRVEGSIIAEQEAAIPVLSVVTNSRQSRLMISSTIYCAIPEAAWLFCYRSLLTVSRRSYDAVPPCSL